MRSKSTSVYQIPQPAGHRFNWRRLNFSCDEVLQSSRELSGNLHHARRAHLRELGQRLVQSSYRQGGLLSQSVFHGMLHHEQHLIHFFNASSIKRKNKKQIKLFPTFVFIFVNNFCLKKGLPRGRASQGKQRIPFSYHFDQIVADSNKQFD